MRILLLALATTTTIAQAGDRRSSYGYGGGSSYGGGDVYVRPYTRDNGSYVEPHYRSAPSSSSYDNSGTRGNSNPYTGARGARSPW